MNHYHLLAKNIEDTEFHDYKVTPNKEEAYRIHFGNHDLYPELFRLSWCNHEDCQVDAEDS